jgi:cobalt-zinc-cadmium efflux system protein
MNVGTKSSLLSLAVADTAVPARYTAALDLGRAERSHHFGIVTLFHRAGCLARVARRRENALASARAIESRKHMASHQAHEHGHGHHHDHHGHQHGHHHGHSHAPATFGSAFAIATVLNIALVAIQAAYGVLAHSMALLADAGHNAGDVLALVLAWGSHAISQKHPTERYTYGFRSSSIIAALINATILLVVTGAIAWAAVERLFAPQPVAGATVMVVAALAILINGAAAAVLARGNTSDLNVYGAFLHLVADAAVSAGVVVAGLVILVTGWLWVDPVASLVISGVIVWSTWGVLRDAAKMSLQGVPSQIDPGAVRVYLQSLPAVVEVHDLHIWPMSTTETALTCHLVMPDGDPQPDFLEVIYIGLQQRFGIGHPTIQIERGDRPCKLSPEHIV